MNFHLYTAVYGSKHIDLFRRACFRSMNWPLNGAAVESRSWHVLTKPEHFDEISRIFEGSQFKLKLFAIEESQRVAGCGMVRTSQCDSGVILLNGFKQQMQFCLSNKSKMILCPPDTVFGDGTIPNLLSLGVGEGVCVAVAHARVLPNVIEEIETLAATRGAMSNSQLVSMAFNYPHASWEYAEAFHENNNSYVGGISWRELDKGLYSVTHRLPTPYLLDFNITDWDYFWGTVSFGALDHSWPGDRLYRQERIRVCGSSDACFIVEITDSDQNVPPIVEKRKEAIDPDSYWGDRVHHSTNRLFNIILRGE